jgi:hypothetical protein
MDHHTKMEKNIYNPAVNIWLYSPHKFLELDLLYDIKIREIIIKK